MNRGNRLFMLGLSAVMGFAAVVVLGWVTPAWAANCSTCMKLTQRMIPLHGDWSCGDDLVNLQGRLHLVTRVIMSSASTRVDVHANLADVMGVGSPSGDMYLATGADEMGVEAASTPIVGSLNFNARFHLRPAYPPNPCRSTVLPVRISLQFQEDGSLIDASAVVGEETD